MKTTAQITAPILKRELRVKKTRQLADYFGIMYLTRAYYEAMKNKTELPERALPELQDLLDAQSITMAYVQAKNASTPIKLFMSLLKPEQVVAVWLFYNEPTLNIRLGNYQLLALNHK